jgi:hypothetical protein
MVALHGVREQLERMNQAIEEFMRVTRNYLIEVDDGKTRLFRTLGRNALRKREAAQKHPSKLA